MLQKFMDWLLSLVFKAPVQQILQEETSNDLFKPSERRIYRYFDGKGVIDADPMVLWKELMEVGPELNVDIKLSRSPSKDARKGHDGAVNKVRKVFKLNTYEQGGLTETECMLLLGHFLDYMGAVKKNGQENPTSAEETGSSTPNTTNESSEVPPATSLSSDSGPYAEDSKEESHKSCPLG